MAIVEYRQRGNAQQPVHSPHPISGEPGKYVFIGGIGFSRIDTPYADVGQVATKETGALRLRPEDPRSADYANRNLGGPDHNRSRMLKTGTFGWSRGADYLRAAGFDEHGNNAGVGWGNFTQDSWDALKAAGGSGMHPLIDTNPGDHAEILKTFADSNYNPFLWTNQREGGAIKGSVPDFLFNELKKQEGIKNRLAVMNAYQMYKPGEDNSENIKSGVLRTHGNSYLEEKMMSEALFNEMGLGSIFGDYTGGRKNASMTNNRGFAGMNGMLGSAAGKFAGGLSDGYQFNSKFSQPREKRQRHGVWGSGFNNGGYGLLSEENEVMRDAIANQLEEKLLG